MGFETKFPKMPCLRFLFYFHYFVFFSTLLLTAMCTSAAGGCAVGPTETSVPLVSFLQRLQSEALKTLGPKSFDPKLYVDLPLKQDLVVTEEAFAKLQRVNGTITSSELAEFVNSFFGEAGDDLVYEEPKDFVPEPKEFLPKVKNPKVRAWALQVHSIWKNLSRRISDDVREWPERHTLLSLPEPVVIPGSRFREVYYWDSYWIVRGLLVSKMYDTAKAVVNNLLWLIEVYGHVLNGARVYYSNRSQPPLLTSMVREIYMKTGDLAFAKKAVPLLIKEHLFWNKGFHRVVIRDLQGREHSLSRHYAFWDTPRPESATIDEESASKLPTASDKEAFYRQVASTAETGWDFSSRWMRDSSDLTTLSATSIIPVDLNAYLYKMELDLEFLAQKVGDATASKNFKEASKARLSAMTSIFWNAEMNQWLDYWLSTSTTDCEDIHQFDAKNQNDKIFASNFIPLWAWNSTSDTRKYGIMVENILESFQNSGLLRDAGISTSLLNSSQQWDFPNGWAPLQHVIIEGFANSGSKAARSLAEDMAIRWIKTNYAAFVTTSAMHEKYDVEACGKVGGGGEYKPQTGFGWSNGVVLALLEEFGWPQDRELEC